MRYLFIILFNLFGFYILGAFVFGNGGMIDNIEKMEMIYTLKTRTIEEEIKLNEMRYELNQLRSIESSNPNLMAQKGMKYEDTVIFRFDESLTELPEETIDTVNTSLDIKIYAMIAIVLILMVAGNAILVLKLVRA